MNAFDTAGLGAAIRRADGPLGTTLGTATVVADRDALWFGVCGLLLVSQRRQQRHAGVAGLASLAVSSIVTHATKALVGRNRPSAELRRGASNLGKVSATASFPSGHSANAFAVTVAVGIQDPRIGAALVPVALAVAGSRLVTARHYPSDVIAGIAVGALVGTAVGVGVQARYRSVHSDREGDATNPPVAKSTPPRSANAHPGPPHPVETIERRPAGRRKVSAAPSPLSKEHTRTKQQLYAEAQRRDLRGRSAMTKAQLEHALASS